MSENATAPPEFAAALETYLRREVPGLEGPMRMERISGGQSNPTYFVTFDNRRLVLRKQPPGNCCLPRTPWTANTALSVRSARPTFLCRRLCFYCSDPCSSARRST